MSFDDPRKHGKRMCQRQQGTVAMSCDGRHESNLGIRENIRFPASPTLEPPPAPPPLVLPLKPPSEAAAAARAASSRVTTGAWRSPPPASPTSTSVPPARAVARHAGRSHPPPCSSAVSATDATAHRRRRLVPVVELTTSGSRSVPVRRRRGPLRADRRRRRPSRWGMGARQCPASTTRHGASPPSRSWLPPRASRRLPAAAGLHVGRGASASGRRASPESCSALVRHFLLYSLDNP